MFITDEESAFIEEAGGGSAVTGDRIVDGTGNPLINAGGDNIVTGSTTPP